MMWCTGPTGGSGGQTASRRVRVQSGHQGQCEVGTRSPKISSSAAGQQTRHETSSRASGSKVDHAS